MKFSASCSEAFVANLVQQYYSRTLESYEHFTYTDVVEGYSLYLILSMLELIKHTLRQAVEGRRDGETICEGRERPVNWAYCTVK